MFNIQDKVIYGTNGICTIIDITVKKIGKEKIEYYVLKPEYSNTSTLFVPTQNETLVSKMRKIKTKEQISEILENLPKNETEWNTNKNARFDNSRAIISNGDYYELINLIRTLLIHEKILIKRGRRLHIVDEKFLKEAEKMVIDEMVLVLGETKENILKRIL